jgi:hypothetical protein
MTASNSIVQFRSEKGTDLVSEQAIASVEEVSEASWTLYRDAHCAGHLTPRFNEVEQAITLAKRAMESGAIDQFRQWVAGAREKATRKEIIDAATILIGSNPRPAQDLQIFGRLLCEDLIAAAPTRIALHDTMRRLRRTCEHTPTIAAVLQALEATERRFITMESHLAQLPASMEAVLEKRAREAKIRADRVAAFERRRDEREKQVTTVANDPDWQSKTADLMPDRRLNEEVTVFLEKGLEGFRAHYDDFYGHPESGR